MAASLIERASRERPADALLRETGQANKLRGERRRVLASAVFAYYRWREWLDKAAELPVQIQDALALDEQFQKEPGSFKDEDLCAKAVPSWCSEMMRVTPEWVRSLQTPASLWLRAKPGTGEAIAKRLGNSVLHPAIPDAIRYTGSEDLFLSPLFHEGLFEIQDISSQAIGWMCAAKPGETWWDACAGEGGKTLHLSALMQNKGLIWATDRATWRLAILKRRANRAQVFNYRTAEWMRTEHLPTKTKFDGILLDAPCSGLGTWQRNPHARWTTSIEDVRELAAIQLQLLRTVCHSLKPGGRLIYAVCTLTMAETHGAASAFTAAEPKLKPVLLQNPFNASSAAEQWFWPQATSGNGMFAAAWSL